VPLQSEAQQVDGVKGTRMHRNACSCWK